MFAPSLRGGGAERNIVHLAGGLVARGHRIALVLGEARGPFLAEVHADVELVDLGVTRMAASIGPLARFLRKRRPSALLSTPAYANVIAVIARKLSGVPMRLVLREANTLSQTAVHSRRLADRLLPHLVRLTYPHADAVVGVSEGVSRDLRETAGLMKVYTIPNASIIPFLPELAREPITHPWMRGDTPVILAIGRLTAQKDYPTLLQAFRKVRAQRPCRLVILGEGPERRSLESLAGKLELSDHVSIPGFVVNPFPYIASAAVLALSSRWEGWPNVLAQALALGTPVVATDCPHGPREILEEGRYGALVPVGDHAALASALARVLDSPPDPVPLMERAGKFTLESAIDSYEDLLQPAKQ